jgi:hypothetical protein
MPSDRRELMQIAGAAAALAGAAFAATEAAPESRVNPAYLHANAAWQCGG